MSSPDSKSPSEEILSSLESLVKVSEQCSLRLRKHMSRVRLARSLLTGLLLFVGLSTVAVAVIVTKFSFSFFAQNHTLALIIFGLFILIGFVSGIVSYVMLGRKQDTNLSKLSSLIEELKKEGNSNPAPIANILLIIENILAALPSLVRRRNQDAVLFGLLVAVFTIVFFHFLVASVVVGALVWVYFRFQANRTYNKEISSIEEQKRKFERQKQDFIESL